MIVDVRTGEIVTDLYASMEMETRIIVRQKTDEIRVLVRKSAQDVVDIGEKLSMVKAWLGHGAFGEWLNIEFGWNERTARRFMSVYTAFKTDNLSDMNIAPSALYLLASPSTPDDVVTGTLERAREGEAITYSGVKAEISKAAYQLVHSDEEERVESLARAIEAAPAAVQQVVIATGIANAAVVPMLTHAFTKKLETWEDIVNTGTLDGERPIGNVSAAEFDDHLGRKAYEHRAAAIESAQEPDAARPHVANNSGNNEWYTPAYLIESARRVMGRIDLDPASCAIANRTVKAGRYYTKENSAFDHDWNGSIWLNPPYAQPLCEQFIQELAEQFQAGKVYQACVLVNNATETRWGQLLLDLASAVCFLRTRVRFLDAQGDASGSPLQGQMVVYIGQYTAGFIREFGSHGKVLSDAR